MKEQIGIIQDIYYEHNGKKTGDKTILISDDIYTGKVTLTAKEKSKFLTIRCYNNQEINHIFLGEKAIKMMTEFIEKVVKE